jgi:hypothetical protein
VREEPQKHAIEEHAAYHIDFQGFLLFVTACPVVPKKQSAIDFPALAKKTPGETGRKLRRLSAEEFANGVAKCEERVTSQYFVMMKFRARFLHF